MLESFFDSRDLPASDRVEAWREVTASALVSNEFSVDRPAEFHASLKAADLGGTQVAALTYASMRTRRTPRLIRQSDPEMYAVGLILRGEQVIFQGRTESSLTAGDLVVYSTSHPYGSVVDAQRGPAASAVVQLPRTMVPLPPNRVDRLLAARMPGGEGVGRLLAGFLTHLTTDTGSCRPADGQRLGGVLADLVVAWLAHHIDAADQICAETRRHTQFLEIRDFIGRHLGDAELSPAAIAAAHHVSLRTLHRLFRHHGTSVAAFVRQQRLERSRRDLLDPALRRSTIASIAARWGFPSAADFTRAFRAAYDMPPGEYRCLFAGVPSKAPAGAGRR